MKKTILLLFPLILLTSCGESNYDKCAGHIKTHLKSPSSYQLISSSGYKYEGHIAYKIRFEADNSFGVSISDYAYVHIDTDRKIECSFCEVLPGNSSFYFFLGSQFGDEL